jgi:5-methylcytosine-specific restriction endonuclease McrA
MPMATIEEQREYQRLWVKKRRDTWLKENGPCVVCGSWENLEVDHEDPQKKVTHRVFSWSKERREEELSKCRALCYDCHKEKTALELSEKFSVVDPTRWKHGTNNTYNKHKCRCEKCVEWRRSKFVRLGT